ncbi:MAG: hypothetical protein ACP5D5_07560 [Acidithiobacillus sp.]|uniref:hypothetical protein n=1 Tax=Acidithiobacillus sp. TaxID=1872118 RepID=UPI003D08D1B8
MSVDQVSTSGEHQQERQGDDVEPMVSGGGSTGLTLRRGHGSTGIARAVEDDWDIGGGVGEWLGFLGFQSVPEGLLRGLWLRHVRYL